MRKLRSETYLKDVFEILRVGMYSMFNSYKYNKDSLLYPYVNFKTNWEIFKTGKRDIKSFDILKNIFASPEGESLIFKDIRIPIPKTEKEIVYGLLIEIQDLIIPYMYDDKKIIHGTAVEGPYELNEVYLEKGDVVVDAGSNMGVFSAIASVKGCQAIAFEPMPENINNYLNKTAEWNKNITVAPYALSDNTGTLKFANYEGGITMGHRTDVNGNPLTNVKADMQIKDEIEVPCITLDDYISKNNINKIDFIKADIEGSERYLLKGAKNVLKEFAPKISICTYHLKDDPKVLRDLIWDANPNYCIFEKYKKMYAYIKK